MFVTRPSRTPIIIPGSFCFPDGGFTLHTTAGLRNAIASPHDLGVFRYLVERIGTGKYPGETIWLLDLRQEVAAVLRWPDLRLVEHQSCHQPRLPLPVSRPRLRFAAIVAGATGYLGLCPDDEMRDRNGHVIGLSPCHRAMN